MKLVFHSIPQPDVPEAPAHSTPAVNDTPIHCMGHTLMHEGCATWLGKFAKTSPEKKPAPPHDMRYKLLQCGDVEEDPGPKPKIDASYETNVSNYAAPVAALNGMHT